MCVEVWSEAGAMPDVAVFITPDSIGPRVPNASALKPMRQRELGEKDLLGRGGVHPGMVRPTLQCAVEYVLASEAPRLATHDWRKKTNAGRSDLFICT